MKFKKKNKGFQRPVTTLEIPGMTVTVDDAGLTILRADGKGLSIARRNFEGATQDGQKVGVKTTLPDGRPAHILFPCDSLADADQLHAALR